MNPRHQRRETAFRGPVMIGLGCCLLLTAACGTRQSRADVLKAEGAGGAAVTAGGDGGASAVAGGVVPGARTGGAAAPGTPGAATTGGGLATSGGSTGTPAGGGTTGTTSGGGTTGSTSGGGTTGSSSTGTTGATGGGCTKVGKTIVLGQVVSASGIIGANVGSAIPVLQAWAKYINASGGIACHPVSVLGRDDASDPGKASSAVQDLVENRKAVGIVASFVPLSISGFKSAVDKEKVPVIGGDLFSTTWWDDPLFYPVGTYVNANAFGSSQALAASGQTKVAVIYCIEAGVCPPYKDAVVQNASKGRYTVVYDKQVSITQPTFTSECQSAKAAGATQINMILEGGGVARFASSCANLGYYPKFAVASLGATFDPNSADVQKMTATIASAANDWFTASVPGQKAFQDSMKRYAPNLKLDPTSILAWADGMMVKAAIERLGAEAQGDITTAMLRKALAKTQNETLDGLITPNSFSPSQGVNPKNMCYFTDQFRGDGKWHRLNQSCLS
jgi:branched-chain amino acid transport system substrate-binding protein